MTILNIGKCRSLIEIEEALSKIEISAEGARFIFPLNSLKARHGPMHDASRLQMVVTLARQRLHSDYIDIHPNASEEAAIDEVCSYSPGIAGVRLARGIRLGQLEIDRRDVLLSAVNKMQDTDAEKFDRIIRGRSLDLMCVAGSRVQYLRPLFTASGVVKEHTEMRKTMQTLIDFINKASKGKIPKSLVDSLGLFSSELIQNTQEHAIKNHSGKPYLAHVEGMMLGWTQYREKLFSEDFSGSATLQKFWSRESALSSLRAFEVSYFDSGPGLVSRLKGVAVKDITLEDERRFLLECLKHKSTSKSESAAGEGLPSVLEELKKIGGLIRIRSGRMAIFNAFSRNDTQREISDFEDWSSMQLAPVEGAVISILVPLRSE